MEFDDFPKDMFPPGARKYIHDMRLASFVGAAQRIIDFLRSYVVVVSAGDAQIIKASLDAMNGIEVPFSHLHVLVALFKLVRAALGCEPRSRQFAFSGNDGIGGLALSFDIVAAASANFSLDCRAAYKGAM